MNGRSVKKGIAALLSVVTLISALGSVSVSAAPENQDLSTDLVDFTSDYEEYVSKYADEYSAADAIEVDVANYLPESTVSGGIKTDYEGQKGSSIENGAKDTLSYSVFVESAALYTLTVRYYPILAGDSSSIRRDVYIDGKLPYKEAEGLTFERVWDNENEEPVYDLVGNQVMPFQAEAPQWTEKTLCDDSGLLGNELYFYLSQGEHKITLSGGRGDMLIGEITLTPKREIPTYAEIKSTYEKEGYKALGKNDALIIEGEDAVRKSDQTMYPQADRSSPTTQPYNHAYIVYNTIGSTQWKSFGQWLEWDFEVKEGGLANIALHYKQSLKSGDVSVRELCIDGNVPFAEAADLTFAYDSAWQLSYLSDKEGTPYEFYLSPGKHTIRMRVVFGSNAEILSLARECLAELNSIYRKIVVVTGASPDMYRDYKLDMLIPDAIEQMGTVAESLKKLEKLIHKRNADGSQNTSDIKRLYNQLEQMLDDTDTVSKRLKNYKDNVSSFGTWINNAMQQPLEVDYIRIDKPNTKLGKGEAGVFSMLSHYFKQFLASFSTNYSSIGQVENKGNEQITVWMTSGRDQAQILKQLVNSKFTPENKIAVDLQLVTEGTLLPALLAGIGPDVSLSIAQTEPVNMALRGALYDLSKFEDIDEFSENFYPASIEPFRFNGGLWALPETLTYPMLFYRTDVLEELGISVDDLATWDSVLGKVLPELQNSSLSFGILPALNNYLLFLYQRGGTLYDEKDIYTKLNTNEAISAMKDYSMLYTQYGLNLSYDFANRFRSGEIPVAIADFTSYNQLSIFAPEIKNLWGMLPVPGTKRADGTIDHTAIGLVTGSVILSSAESPESCWTFLKWWLSAPVQSAYGTLLESVVGSAARYNTANRNSMDSVAWDADIKDNLEIQAGYLQARKEVPGGYYTTRLYDFAFRSIVYDSEDVRETMNDTTIDINREIENRRIEYELPLK